MLNFVLSRLWPQASKTSVSETLSPSRNSSLSEPQEMVTEDASEDSEQPPVPITEQPVGPVPGLNNEEKSDDYSKVAVRLNDQWRVIVCKLGIQWILQFQKGSYKGKPAWRGRSYCRSKVGICRVVGEHAGQISPEAEAQLAQLPDWVES